MAIPEQQLETWSHQGATTTANATYESVKIALTLYEWPSYVNYEVYLQGSYKNYTNIRGDSDVDIIIQLNSTFYHNLSTLQMMLLNIRTASYGWNEFRADVLRRIIHYYGSNMVTEGNKSIKVNRDSGRLAADIVVSAKYIRYDNLTQSAEGLTFWTLNEGRQIINYPKIHYTNGVLKNNIFNTNGNFKPTVRIFKNARTYLINQNEIFPTLAPSYFLECLIYNIPNSMFESNFQSRYSGIIDWLSVANLIYFVCQNGQMLLFGKTPEQWTITDAQTLIQKFAELWRNY